MPSLLLLRRMVLITLALACFGSLRLTGGEFALRPGDRVVFYGDSITDQRLYTTFVETFVVTRFPKLNVSFVHSGWGGDRVTGGGGGSIALRLDRDVIAYKPTVMTIMLGMNDGSYRAFDQGIFNTYSTGYENIVRVVREKLPGIRLTLIEPSPFDDVTQPPRFEGGYNSVLVRYGAFVRDLALREKLGVADLNGPVVAALHKAKATDSELAKKIIPDRVHPGASGHLLMAAELLKAWNAPATVSSVEIAVNAGTPRPTLARAERARVDALELQAGGRSVRWVQEDEALPMPLDQGDAAMGLALKSSDFVERLNQQRLKVAGLGGAAYELVIDSARVGTFTGKQLAEGVNLAALPTPMAVQAAEVHKKTLQHNNTHFKRWRQVQVPLADQKNPQVQKAVKRLMDALDDQERVEIAEQRAAARPRKHTFQLNETTSLP